MTAFLVVFVIAGAAIGSFLFCLGLERAPRWVTPVGFWLLVASFGTGISMSILSAIYHR